MPLPEQICYQPEPTPLQCGQAVLAMLCAKSVTEIIELVNTDRETTLADMKRCLAGCGIGFDSRRRQISSREELPPVCVLSLETPRCWHWSLYFKGTFFDPEYGILKDFPPSARRYCFEITQRTV